MRVKAWDLTTPQAKMSSDSDGVILAPESWSALLKENLAVTDAKSLYDSLRKTARGKESRVALAVAEIRQSLAACSATPRWVPHNVQICDPLTKTFSKANVQPILGLLKTGTYHMASEVDEETYRKNLKMSGQMVQRLRGKSAAVAEGRRRRSDLTAAGEPEDARGGGG